MAKVKYQTVGRTTLAIAAIRKNLFDGVVGVFIAHVGRVRHVFCAVTRRRCHLATVKKGSAIPLRHLFISGPENA